MARESKDFNRRWLWLVTAVILVVVFFSVRSLTRQRLVVRIARVESGPLASTVSTNGRVEPEDNREYTSPVSATVKGVFAEQGDKVPKGKVLIELDDLEARAHLAAAESGVKSAQVALEAVTHNGTQEQRQASEAELARNRIDRDQAQRNLDALVKLSASGAASQSEVAAAREQLASANANLNASQQSASGRYSPAEVARAEAALRDAEANAAAAREVVANCTYRAPVAGTVYSIDTRQTEFAEQGKILLQMADLTRERVRAYFDEPEIGRLSVGQAVQIRWDARPGQLWTGHIVRVPITVITFGNRTVGETIIQVDGGNDGLLPSTSVTVTVTTSSESNVLNVPREALYSENGKPYVFKVVNDSLVRTPVVTGSLNMTQIGIVSGLREGDVVATGTTSGQPLQIGIPIQVVQ
ncbi:MAG TPA: efflux RND transporter periplasmic adaptor subunit [Terracidiphilus sp.]|jgi:HlyD family secretion protein|nr:efflux RND transporter periplasmic adaptor subunit [Terracidiphilus sp.]